MPLPVHVRAICAATNVVFLVVGLRDVFAPGVPLPGAPGDDRAMLMWGSVKTKKDGLVAAPVEGVMLFLEQVMGCMLITAALAKLVAVFSHSESTFLRRNLLVSFGLTDLLTASFVYSHSEYAMSTYGADLMPYVVIMVVEGLAFLYDALMRERKVKKK